MSTTPKICNVVGCDQPRYVASTMMYTVCKSHRRHLDKCRREGVPHGLTYKKRDYTSHRDLLPAARAKIHVNIAAEPAAPAPRPTDVRMGELCRGTTVLRIRYPAGRRSAREQYAPVYVGDAATHEARRQEAFTAALRLGIGAVVVDNVLYPTLTGGGFYVWKKP